MGNFVRATEYDVHMYVKFRDFTFYLFFVNKYSKIWVMEIFYEAIMHKMVFGQSYCKDLLQRILWKFIIYFSKFYSIYYDF
jgi:hypothetical protein